MGRWLDQLTENTGAAIHNNPPTVAATSPAPSPVSAVRDAEATGRGWLVLAAGAAYEQSLARYAAVYVLRNDNADTWQVWRGAWRKGDPEPYQQKVIAQGVGFAQAMARGSNYAARYRAKGKPSKEGR